MQCKGYAPFFHLPKNIDRGADRHKLADTTPAPPHSLFSTSPVVPVHFGSTLRSSSKLQAIPETAPSRVSGTRTVQSRDSQLGVHPAAALVVSTHLDQTLLHRANALCTTRSYRTVRTTWAASERKSRKTRTCVRTKATHDMCQNI